MASKNERLHASLSCIHRKHFCPTCDEPVKHLVMRMPGRSMWGTCENGHHNPKAALILK